MLDYNRDIFVPPSSKHAVGWMGLLLFLWIEDRIKNPALSCVLGLQHDSNAASIVLTTSRVQNLVYLKFSTNDLFCFTW